MNIPNTHKKIKIFIGVLVCSLLGFYSISLLDETDKTLSDDSSIVRSSKKTQNKLDGKANVKRINIKRINIKSFPVEKEKGNNDLQHWRTVASDIMKNKDCSYRGSAFCKMGQDLWALNQENAYNIAEEILRTSPRRNCRDITSIFEGIAFAHAKENPEAAVEKFISMHPGPPPEDKDLPTDIKKERELRIRSYEQQLHGLMSGWGTHDPHAALAFADKGVERIASCKVVGNLSDLHYYVIREVYCSWAKSDPISALQSASSQEGESQRNLIKNIFVEWTNRDPWVAANHAGQLQDGDLRNLVLSKMLSQWAKNDVGQAAQWAAEMPVNSTARENILTETSIDLIYPRLIPPETAIKIYDMLSADNSKRTIFVRRMMKYWSMEDPQAAANWATTIKDQNLLNIAFKELPKQWTSRDINGAYEWGIGLQDSKEKAIFLSEVAKEQGGWERMLNEGKSGTSDPWYKDYKANMEQMIAPAEWIRELPSGPSRDRVTVAYISGNILTKDYKSHQKIEAYLSKTENIDRNEVGQIIQMSRIKDEEKKKLLDFLTSE